MTSQPPAENPHPDQAAPAPVVGAAELAANVQTFWERNRTVVIGACVAGVLAIVAVEGWRLYAASRDRAVRQEFAQASADETKLGRFAAEHPSHPLAGAAHLTIADRKFEAGEFAAAAQSYAKAAAAPEIGVLGGRARLGEAISRILGGDRAAGEAALKALSADTAQPKPVRAEATYHLASIALEAGNKEEAAQLARQVSEIDPGGMWARRAEAIRASAETAAAPADAPATDALFKPSGK